MIGHVLARKGIMKQIVLLMEDNGRKGADYPEGPVMHSLHVGILSTLLVMEILPHLARNTLIETAMGFLFHDIGMMRLGPKVVNYAGPLTEAICPLVRQHPAWGLEDMEKARCASTEASCIITGHHERPDGRGYPGCMKRDDLHFFVKVCAVLRCDDLPKALQEGHAGGRGLEGCSAGCSRQVR